MMQLNRILETATAGITSAYFHVAIDGGDPIYRERVYAYELYHQMRSHWPQDTPYYPGLCTALAVLGVRLGFGGFWAKLRLSRFIAGRLLS
jgi:hypothetical protein